MDIKREIRDRATGVNTGDAYIDMEGNTRQFTHVDHDPKTKKSMFVETGEDLHKLVQQGKEERILEILALPAVSAAMHTTEFSRNFHEQFIKRDKEGGITWNETAVRTTCLESFVMAHNLWIHCWRFTVRPEYWWGPYLTHEEILEGKWKELMA